MKSQILAVVFFSIPGFDACAQTNTFDFTTSLGDGSFTLNANNLTLLDSTGYAAVYFDAVDVFTFNGTNFNNLLLTVINNWNPGGPVFVDGFDVQAGYTGVAHSTVIELSAGGTHSVVNGTSVSDLFTVLSSFDALNLAGFVMPYVSFESDWPNAGQDGSLDSFELVATPEPSILSLSSLGILSLSFCLHKKLPAARRIVARASRPCVSEPPFCRSGN